tara:strand:+ start:595 stop:1410 length:816 start_codon:yes stop_codon:yes gene_type:complete
LDKLLIKKYLELLGINSIENLESKDIDYWWLLKFKQIQSDDKVSAEGKQRYLIKINNAKDNLSEIDISELKKILLNNNSKNTNSNNYGKPKNEERNHKNDASNVEDNPSRNKEYQSEEISSNKIIYLILIIFSFVITIGYFIANTERQDNRQLTLDDFELVPIKSNNNKTDYRIEFLKKGSMDKCSNIYMKDLVKGIKNHSWYAFEADDGEDYVNIEGQIYVGSELVEILLQYKLDLENDRFNIYYFEVDGKAQDNEMINNFVEILCNNAS